MESGEWFFFWLGVIDDSFLRACFLVDEFLFFSEDFFFSFGFDFGVLDGGLIGFVVEGEEFLSGLSLSSKEFPKLFLFF